ncbi:hypothetical protein BC830DRAFT_1100702 [Chytriomyces sp. MP71]|nr:hypothetical protein BC830DRAFT_1100702 [Chytriomyces sp. MP71]
MSPLLQFAPFSSAVEANFWHALTQRKMDEFKLDASARSIRGTFGVGASNLLCVAGGAFDYIEGRIKVRDGSGGGGGGDRGGGEPSAAALGSLGSLGSLINTNTVEEFRNADKNALLRQAAAKLWDDILSGEALSNHHLLATFTLLTFADLKKYKFYYWFAFPALLPTEHFTVSSITPLKDAWVSNMHLLDSLRIELDAFLRRDEASRASTFSLVKQVMDGEGKEKIELGTLKDWDHFWSDVPRAKWTVLFADPSNLFNNPGWPLRNFLILLKHRFKIDCVNVICYRESLQGGGGKRDQSPTVIMAVSLPGSLPDECPKFVGWEKNPAGKLGPRIVDLAPMMDPNRLAETAVDLNLKLMRWRIMPQLQLEKISETKCLLLGSGTLGCYVARALMAWGVRKITLVDNGTVSYSNPVRQPLFTFEDSIAGKPKAAAAADTLKSIFPGIEADGINFSIPMPGHPSSSFEATERDVAKLGGLIESHDVVFLLTDSREARWLPTVMGAAAGKVVINTALGFDTFLVMRHGVRVGEPPALCGDEVHGGLMGCYYCNDVVAPTDSLSDRTLDQQCTVTRPGLSLLASGLAVELMVSLLNHPNGAWAPSESVASPTDPTSQPLGIVPHQIRGFLTHFQNLLVHGRAYDKCTACSPAVLAEFQKDNANFVHKVLAEPKYLEELTGLTKMQNETDAADVDWDEEDDF